MKKVLRYLLQSEDSTPVELANAPDGWENSIVKFARSDSYRGLIKSFSFPFKFVLYGATLLRKAMYQYSIKANVLLLIDRLDPNANEYNRIFNAKIDFSKAQDERASFTVNAVNGDLTAKLAAYEDVKFQIPIDVPQSRSLKLLPLTLKETALLNITNRNNGQSDTFPGISIVSNAQNSVTASVQEVQSTFETDPDYSASPNWFYRATLNTPVRIKIDITDIRVIAVRSGIYTFELRNHNGTMIKQLFQATVTGGGIFIPFEVHEDFVYNASKNETLYLYFDSSNDDGPGGFDISTSVSSIELSYNTISPATICKAVPILYLFQQLISKINGDTYPATSDLLTGMLGNVYITSSDAIRKIESGGIYQQGDTLQMGTKYIVLGGAVIYNGITYPINGIFDYVQGANGFTTTDNGFVQAISFTPVVNISFKQFFNSVKSWMGGQAGFGIESAAVLEDLRYFYRAGLVSLDAGSIANWKLTPATQLIPNAIKIGQEDQQYDSINGTLEVNSEQRYTTPVDTLDGEQSANTLELLSDIRTDAYGIEQTRIQPVDSSASRSDNDTFAVWCDTATDVDGNLVPLSLAGVDLYSGIGSDYYNWKFSPKHCLSRGGDYLASLFYGMGIYSIKFAGGDKNTNMVIIEDGVRIAESEDILIGNLPAPIFLPYFANISVGTPFNALDLIQSAPYGVIKYNYHGVEMRGFIEEVSVNVGENSAQDFQVLLSPDNNLLALVR